MRCIHTSQRCISSGQMTDNVFEIKTTALAHIACAPQESGVLLTDFAAAYPSVNHSWIFSVIENTGLPFFLCRFLRNIYRDSMTHVVFRGSRTRTIFHGQRSTTRLSCEWFPLASDESKSQLSQRSPTTWNSCSLHNALTLTIPPLVHPLLEG